MARNSEWDSGSFGSSDQDVEYLADLEESDTEEGEEIAAGPTPLKRKQSRWLVFLFLLVFTVIWDGVVAVFFVQLVYKFNIFLFIFLIPFALVGIALFVATIYTFLALFNPLPQLVLENPHLVPGATSSVRWSFRGGTWSLRSLTLTLIGRESATYQHGTTSYTDTNDFCKLELFRTDHPSNIAQGTAEFTIPERTMHSFAAKHNTIEWLIQVHGDVRLWPDVNEEFTVVVFPS